MKNPTACYWPLYLASIFLVFIRLFKLTISTFSAKMLSEKEQFDKMQLEDFRELAPLFYGHITSYGEFQLDMNKRINIEETPQIIKWPQDAAALVLPLLAMLIYSIFNY